MTNISGPMTYIFNELTRTAATDTFSIGENIPCFTFRTFTVILTLLAIAFKILHTIVLYSQ